MNKICCICKKELPKTIEYFAKKGNNFQCQCRKCQKEYRKNHYLNNKQKYIDKAKKYTKTTASWFEEIKKKLVCSVCGESRFWVLDFHHVDPNEKENNISILVRVCNKTKIIEEISKCNVLCSNCHRDLHYKEKQADNA